MKDIHPRLALWVALVIGASNGAGAALENQVRVNQGLIEGSFDPNTGVRTFKGIPFAAPPIGELRWKAPQPVAPWSGVRKTQAYAPGPMQDARFAAVMGATTNLSEDCLYLNVWTTARTTEDRLPVMVWIYGGAFAGGMTGLPVYDGTRLAQKGVVLVSIAYRVGPFGFLAHPELSKESGGGSGCYGIQDQVAGLRWVKDSIAQFGGDPARVTIFGDSAGGISVSMLTVVPAARGLFQRAISESGGSMAPVKFDNEAGQNVPSLHMAEETGKEFLAKLGAGDLKSARSLSAEAIQKAAPGFGLFWPVADGATIPGDQYELYEEGRFHDTPILIGSNSDEGAMFIRPGATPASFEKQIRDGFGPAADDILNAYPHETEAQAFQSAKDIFRETAFAWPTWAWAALQTRQGTNHAYVYYYDHRTPASPNGATHAAEIGYVFRNLGGWGGATRPEDIAISELLSTYWVKFAKSGDPNVPGLPAWQPFDEQEMKTMIFDREPGSRRLPNLDKIRAFDRYYAWRRAQAERR